MLTDILKEHDYSLTFTLMEIGARPTQSEPFYHLLSQFPSSRILAFEADTKVCEEMNRTNGKQVHYYPHALGKTSEERTFYITKHPMCSSLYRPHESIMELFQNLEVAQLERTSFIDTISVDQFIDRHHISDPIDFIKIDIQGAELEVFQGAEQALRNVLMIVTEVEFVPLYHQQPLFGDVSAFLQKQGFVFHKFLGLEGRAVKPMVMKNNLNFPVQHLWADAVFIRDFLNCEVLSSEQLLKCASFLEIYSSPDMAHHFLKHFDNKNNTDIAHDYLMKVVNQKK